MESGARKADYGGERAVQQRFAGNTWRPIWGRSISRWRRRWKGASTNSAVRIGGKDYRAIGHVVTHKRELPPAETWMDPVVDGFSKLEAIYISPDGTIERAHPVFAFYKARRSQLNRRIFASVGEFSSARMFQIQLLAVVFPDYRVGRAADWNCSDARDHADDLRTLSRHAIRAGREFLASRHDRAQRPAWRRSANRSIP